VNEDQVPSGVAVLPVRTERTMLVPAGRSLCEASELHEAPAPPSKIRERNVPEPGYGVMRSQSTARAAPPLLNSLARTRRELPMDTACVSTRVPSI
jgi:hypothetical protein